MKPSHSKKAGVVKSSIFTYFSVLLLSFHSYAKAKQVPQVKQLKAGELYSFKGQFEDGKSLDAEVKCLAQGEIDKGDLNCGHTKHCTIMKAGETSQTAQHIFECAP